MRCLLHPCSAAPYPWDRRNRVRHGNRSGHCITSGPASGCMAREVKRCQFGRKLDSEIQKGHGGVVFTCRHDQEEMLERAWLDQFASTGAA